MDWLPPLFTDDLNASFELQRADHDAEKRAISFKVKDHEIEPQTDYLTYTVTDNSDYTEVEVEMTKSATCA